MQRRRLTTIVVGSLAVAVGLVACNDDTPACAATPTPTPTPTPFDALRMPNAPKPPAPKPPVYRPPVRRTTGAPASRKQYQEPHQWGQPYGRGRPAAPQPKITIRHEHEYRTYPGYPGYYPIGLWPIGYGETYGCHADREGNPDGY